VVVAEEAAAMGNHSIETFPRQHLHMPHISYPQLNRANPRLKALLDSNERSI